jgi:hypothetical protein
MNSRIFSATACVAAWMMMACPSGATGVRVITEASGGRGHLSAAAEVVGGAVNLRVSHRSPDGVREMGAHLHVRVLFGDSRVDVVRGFAPRSPRARLRQPRDQVLVTVPVKRGVSVREVRVICVPRPHAACHG